MARQAFAGAHGIFIIRWVTQLVSELLCASFGHKQAPRSSAWKDLLDRA